jgi:hypothetical protein
VDATSIGLDTVDAMGIMAGTGLSWWAPSFPKESEPRGGTDWKLVPATSVEAVVKMSSVDKEGEEVR